MVGTGCERTRGQWGQAEGPGAACWAGVLRAAPGARSYPRICPGPQGHQQGHPGIWVACGHSPRACSPVSPNAEPCDPKHKALHPQDPSSASSTAASPGAAPHIPRPHVPRHNAGASSRGWSSSATPRHGCRSWLGAGCRGPPKFPVCPTARWWPRAPCGFPGLAGLILTGVAGGPRAGGQASGGGRPLHFGLREGRERKVCLALTLQQQEIVWRRLAVSAAARANGSPGPTPSGARGRGSSRSPGTLRSEPPRTREWSRGPAAPGPAQCQSGKAGADCPQAQAGLAMPDPG